MFSSVVSRRAVKLSASCCSPSSALSSQPNMSSPAHIYKLLSHNNTAAAIINVNMNNIIPAQFNSICNYFLLVSYLQQKSSTSKSDRRRIFNNNNNNNVSNHKSNKFLNCLSLFNNSQNQHQNAYRDHIRFFNANKKKTTNTNDAHRYSHIRDIKTRTHAASGESETTEAIITDTEEEDNEGMIQVHAYRSIITVAPNPDKIALSELDLSQGEKFMIAGQRKKHQRVLNLQANENPHKILMKHQKDLSEYESTLLSNSAIKFSPPIAYEIWNSPPEVYDRIYGFEADCEPPDRKTVSFNWLYTIWGYYSNREVRYRCTLYSYMKSQRRCQNMQFWHVFELENTFRVELQLLCLHLWFVKTRIVSGFDLKVGYKLSYKTFQMMLDQLPNRFMKHIHGTKSKWQSDCQQACIHLATSLDHALEDYEYGDKQSFAKVIWNEFYLSNKDMSHDLLFLWTEYILANVAHLKDDVTNDDFLNGWWKFMPISSEDDRQRIRQQLIDEHNRQQNNEDADADADDKDDDNHR